MMSKPRGWARATVVLFASGGLIAACTALLDKGSAQCHSDGDCARFGAHPFCRGSICVASGLGPLSCVYGQPHGDQDYLNQCSNGFIVDPGAKEGCVGFDNCVRFGLCSSSGTSPSSPLMAPPVPDAGAPAPAPDGGVVAADEGANLPACRDAAAGRSQVVYISGSSNFIGLLGKLAPTIIARTGLTPVFRTTDSCTGTRSMRPCVGQGCQGGFSAADHFIRDPALGSGGAHAQFFLADGPHDCLLGPNGVEVDVGESEIFPETCGVEKDPAHVAHIPGAVLPILFVVPKMSVEASISAEAAREVLGNGGHVPPWTSPLNFYIRGAATATTRLIGLAIDVPVPANRFWGTDQGSAQKLATNMKLITDYGEAQKSIGTLGSDLYDPDRANLKALGFQAKGQHCAYLPDSPFTRDKKNVRDGHYALWGTLHFFLAQSETNFRSPAGMAFVSLFVAAPVPEDLLNAFIDSSWVPECAMTVQRQSDLGELQAALTPAYPCGCYFDVRVTNMTPPQCVHCDGAADCAGHPDRPVCSFHYCEAAGTP